MRTFGLAVLAAVAAVTAGCGGESKSARIDAAPGELIAYNAGDGIHLVTSDGSDDRKVPGTDALSGPKWAPGGDRFAAVDLSDCCKPYSVTLDGSKRRLPLAADSSTTPAWAPDGKRLAVFDEETLRIRVVRVADGRVEVTFPKSGNSPAWSPDGRTIAFQGRGGDDLLRIFLVGANGRHLQQLTKMTGGVEGETEAAWSPDGRWIAFSSDRDGNRDIYVIRVDGTGLKKVTDNSVDDASPSWSPDGTRLVFARTPSDDRTEIIVRALKSGKETIVASGGYDAGDLVFEPSWQPRKS